VRVQCRRKERSRSLSHLHMSFLFTFIFSFFSTKCYVISILALVCRLRLWSSNMNALSVNARLASACKISSESDQPAEL